MPKLGIRPRMNTLKGPASDNLILVAYGKAKAFGKAKYKIWGDNGIVRLNEKARTIGLDVRVFMGVNESTVKEYNNGTCNFDFYPEVCVAIDGWNSDINGLLLGDATFKKEINRLIKEFNIPGKFYYTEESMQGQNFVSMEGDDITFEWMVKTYGNKLCFDEEARLHANKDLNNVIDMLKSLKIGARQIKNSLFYGVQFVYSKPISDVVCKLHEQGWARRNWDKSPNRAIMYKDNIIIRITKADWFGRRIYIDVN